MYEMNRKQYMIYLIFASPILIGALLWLLSSLNVIENETIGGISAMLTIAGIPYAILTPPFLKFIFPE